MAANSANITDAEALVTGAINVAPKGTTAPTDASTTLATAFKTFYTTADGCTLTIDRTSNEWDAWEADDVVIVDEKKDVTFTFTPMECFGLNETVADILFGADNVETSTGGKITGVTINDSTPDEVVIVVETILRNGDKQRIVMPRFQITSSGAINFKRGAATTSEIAGKCMPDSNGGKAHFYYATPTP